MNSMSLSSIVWVGLFVIIVRGDLCTNNATDSTALICPTHNLKAVDVSFRFQTIRDLAWYLTPREYFMSNANEFTYRSIYEGLIGSCAPDVATLERIQVLVDFRLDDMKISVNNGQKFIRLVCTPHDHTLWKAILYALEALDQLDWESIEVALNRLLDSNPDLLTHVRSFGRLFCRPHLKCSSHAKEDSEYCSAGTRKGYFDRWDSVLSWTDHITDTSGTGFAFMFSSCINDKPSWSVISAVPQLSSEAQEEFWVYPTNQSFNPDFFARQNYQELD